LFGFGNVGLLGLRLGVPAYVAPLVAPAVDLSVLGLLVAIRELALRGAPREETRPARRLLVFASVVTLALNIAEPIAAGNLGKAAFDAVGPLLLIGWAEVGWVYSMPCVLLGWGPRHRSRTWRMSRMVAWWRNSAGRGTARKIEAYPDWAAVTRSTATLRIGAAYFGTGELSPLAPTDGWSTTIKSGTDTRANSGTIFLGKILESFTHQPALLNLNTVDRRNGAVWQTAPYPAPVPVRGIPTMQLTMTPNVNSGTVVAYIYDTDPAGASTLLSEGVYTYAQAVPGKPITATLTFAPIGRDIAKGHRLSLVIDTKDDLYYDMDLSGGTVAFSSPTLQPSQLNLPIG